MKTIANLLGTIFLAAVIVLSMAGCGEDGIGPFNPGENGSEWVSVSQGDTYKQIQIPHVKWRGDVRELGGNSDVWDVNVVTTIRKENGSFGYTLQDEGYDVFDVLHIKSMEPGPAGIGPLPLGHENTSSHQGNSVPGILFMWDRNEEIRDNWYDAQRLREDLELLGFDPDSTTLDADLVAEGYENGLAAFGYPLGIPDEDDNYYPGMLKVHEAIFQRYIAFVLRVKFIDDTYKEYLVKPQRGQLRNVGESNSREGDSYIFYIDEITGDFGDFDGTNYITNVWVESYIDKEIPETPVVQPPKPEPPYSITYVAVDEDGNAIGADGIFTGTINMDDPAPTSVEKGSVISFKVTVPENYILVSVYAGDTELIAAGDVYTFTPNDDVTITAVFEYNPPPIPPPPYTITYEAVNENGNEIDGDIESIFPNAPKSVEAGESISFKVIKPTDDVFVVELIEVRAGETVLTETEGVYSFIPGGDVTVTAIIKIGLPPVDDFEEYHPDEDEDPYGTAVIVTPPERIGNKFVIISTASEGGAEVDPENKWLFGGKPIKNYWDEAINAQSKTNYDAMIKIKNSEGKRATWIWDRSDSWMYGVSGCFTVITASRFYIGEDEDIVESSVPFYFACDNACAVYVNGKLAGYTEAPFADYQSGQTTIVRPKPGETSDWRFTGLSNDDFSGEDMAWNTLYKVDIKSFLTKGYNEILVMAANNDDSGGRWNTTNNPAGLLFACEFSVK